MIRDLERYLKQWNLIRSFLRGRRIVPGVCYFFCSQIVLSFSPFCVLTVNYTLTRRTVCLSHLNIDRFLKFWATKLPVCKEDVLDGVNVICKDVWTQKTRMDCSIMTLLFPLKLVLWKSTLKSCFSAVWKCLFLHAIFRDPEYLDNRNLIRSFWRDPGVFFRARFRILLFHRLSICHFWCLDF